jgi:hypothetical protein
VKAASKRFLAKVRETGWFGGFAIFSRTRAGRRGRAIIEEKPPHSPRPGCHLYGITNFGQEPTDTVGQPLSTEIGVPNMPSLKAKKLGKLPQEKVLLEL